MRFRTIQDISFPTKKTDRKNLFSTASCIHLNLRTGLRFVRKKFSERVKNDQPFLGGFDLY